jgi:hypothetical protein
MGLQQATIKRSLTKEDIIAIINHHPTVKQPYTELAIHLFAFSYFVGGINFIAYLRIKKNEK